MATQTAPVVPALTRRETFQAKHVGFGSLYGALAGLDKPTTPQELIEHRRVREQPEYSPTADEAKTALARMVQAGWCRYVGDGQFEVVKPRPWLMTDEALERIAKVAVGVIEVEDVMKYIRHTLARAFFDLETGEPEGWR